MAGTYSKFKTSKNLEKTGIILDLGEVGKFRIARSGGGNEQFNKRLAYLTKPHRRSIQTGTMDEKLADALLAQTYAECVVLGWEGVTGEDGQPLAFTADACKKLFADLPDLFKIIRETAEDMTLYRQEILEADAKN